MTNKVIFRVPGMLGWLWDMLSYLLEVLGLVERQVEEEQGVRWPLNYSSSAFTPPPPSPHPSTQGDGEGSVRPEP